MSKRRVVITGLGCATPIGISVDAFFDAAVKGKNGVAPITSFDVSMFSTRFGGEVKDFDITQFVDHREGKRMDRFCQLAVASAVGSPSCAHGLAPHAILTAGFRNTVFDALGPGTLGLSSRPGLGMRTFDAEAP